MEGFRFFASGDELDPIGGSGSNYYTASSSDKPSVYYNANAEELAQERLVRQHEIDTQALLQEHTDAHTDERYEQQLESEARSQLALMLWQKSRDFGFRFGSPLSAMKNHIDVLLDQDLEHECSGQVCRFFHIPKGTLFPDLNTAASHRAAKSKQVELAGFFFETLESTGLVYICWSTGEVHICDRMCTALTVDILDETSGYFCAISGVHRSAILDDMPTGRNVTISRHRIELINKGHKTMLEKIDSHVRLLDIRAYNPRSRDQGHADEADEDDGGEFEYAAVPAYVAAEERVLDEREQKAEETAAELVAETEELSSKKATIEAVLDENAPTDDDADEEPDKAAEEEEAADSDDEDTPEDMMFGRKKKVLNPQQLAEKRGLLMPRGSGDVELAGAAPKSSNAFELPNDPDARTAHFLKNLEQRQFDLTKLVESLLEFRSRHMVWEIQLSQESARAQSQLQSYRHKHKYRQMTLSEQHIFLAAHVATYTPPMPDPEEPASLQPYCMLIMRVWEMMARSPYVRDYNKQRLIPNLASTALGVLYNMTQGPVIEDCSLSVRDLPHIPPGLEDLGVRNLKVEVVPHGENLGRYLLPLEQLVFLDLKKKKKTQGLRCFKDCLTSTVDLYRRELADGLRTDPRAAVIRYANACDKLKFG